MMIEDRSSNADRGRRYCAQQRARAGPAPVIEPGTIDQPLRDRAAPIQGDQADREQDPCNDHGARQQPKGIAQCTKELTKACGQDQSDRGESRVQGALAPGRNSLIAASFLQRPKRPGAGMTLGRDITQDASSRDMPGPLACKPAFATLAAAICMSSGCSESCCSGY